MRSSSEPNTAAKPQGRRERAKADKRARILAAAKQGFAERGYERLTMAQVAENADVAIGTVFQYAATKPELLMMVIADRWGDTIPGVIAGIGPNPGPDVVIMSLLKPLLDASIAEPELMAVAARELLFGAPGPHRDTVVALVSELERAIMEALSPEPTEQAQAAARLIVSGALVEVNRSRLRRLSSASVEERLTLLVGVAIAGAGVPTSAGAHNDATSSTP